MAKTFVFMLVLII